MRIIAGTHRGRPLVTPKGNHTRPTRGLVRESIFNIIRNEIIGAAVLDLFAGSGAMGLEALSRGAASVVFVDNAKPAWDAMDQNVRALKMTDRCRLLYLDYADALRRLQSEKLLFDIIFLDPPYEMTGMDTLLSQIQKSGVMKRGALVIFEHAKQARQADNFRAGNARAKWNASIPLGFLIVDERSYGETSASFIQNTSEA